MHLGTERAAADWVRTRVSSVSKRLSCCQPSGAACGFLDLAVDHDIVLFESACTVAGFMATWVRYSVG